MICVICNREGQMASIYTYPFSDKPSEGHCVDCDATHTRRELGNLAKGRVFFLLLLSGVVIVWGLYGYFL